VIVSATAIILAGGQNRRFHSNKALVDWDGQPLVTHLVKKLRSLFSKIFIVTKNPATYYFLKSFKVRLVQDRYLESHALGGIYSGLVEMKTPYAFVCACDMPLIQTKLIVALWKLRKSQSAVVPLWQGYPEPLCAIYGKQCLNVLEHCLEKKRYALHEFIEKIESFFIPEDEVRRWDPQGLSFKDIDTPSEYHRMLKELRFFGC
jgi:molybdopterin-guanine dinucleotide biosynthesis protein A